MELRDRSKEAQSHHNSKAMLEAMLTREIGLAMGEKRSESVLMNTPANLVIDSPDKPNQ